MNDWSFNFRTGHLDDSDDSGTDSSVAMASPNQTVKISEETRLINELDLSTREDTALYKPNPFSISKINAALRPQAQKQRSCVPLTALRKFSNNVILRQERDTSIVSQLKRQALKASVPSRSTGHPIKLGKPSKTLIKPNKSEISPGGTPPKSEAAPSNTFASLPAPIRPITPVSSIMPSPVPIQGLKPAHISTLGSPQSSRSIMAQTDYHKIFPRKLRLRNKLDSRPQKVLKPFLSSPVKQTGAELRSAAFFSSPIWPSPERNTSLRTRPKFAPEFSEQRTRDFQLTKPGAYEAEHWTADISNFLPPEPDSFLLSPAADFKANVFYTEPLILPPRPVGLPHAKGSPAHRPCIKIECTPPQKAYEDATTIYQKATVKKRPRSPPLHSPCVKPDPSYRDRDAYVFACHDPDDQWTTLPPKKKFKASDNKLTSGIKITKPFRLPTLFNKSPPKKSGIRATSNLRIVTFLPPPLESSGRLDHALEHEGSTDERNSPRRHKPGNSALSRTRSYPSPHSSNSSPSRASQHSSLTPQADRALKDCYCPLSPPNSDLPMTEDSNAALAVNVPRIVAHYPRIRKLFRERRRAYNTLWDLLDLPSFGYINCDRDRSTGAKQEDEEVKIVVWHGSSL